MRRAGRHRVDARGGRAEELPAIAEPARAEAERATQLLERVQAVSDVALAHLTLDELLPELVQRIRALLGWMPRRPVRG
jgi:hypothetical protein